MRGGSKRTTNRAILDRGSGRGITDPGHAQVRLSRKRVEDLEDLHDLDAAIKRNAGRPGIPWSEAKKELGL